MELIMKLEQGHNLKEKLLALILKLLEIELFVDLEKDTKMPVQSYRKKDYLMVIFLQIIVS